MDRYVRSLLETGSDWAQASQLYEKLISCEGEDLQIKATIHLARLSKYAPETTLAQAVPILVELLGTPISGRNPSIQEAVAYCLNCLALHGAGSLCALIAQCGSIPLILRLLPQSQAGFRKILLKCLRTIVTCDGISRRILSRNGGLEVILNLISSTNGSRRYLLEILTALAMLREVRLVIISVGGASLLIEAAGSGKMVSRTRAAHVIGLLGITRRVRQMLVGLGVVHVLVSLLREGDMPAKLTAGNALGIISSHIDCIRPVACSGAIPLFAQLLEGQEPLGREIAEDMFCILAVAEENAVAIVEHVVRILRDGNDEAKAAAADVLWDLSGFKHSFSVVGNSGAIPLLLELLSGGNEDVREKASGAIAQLSYDERDRKALVEAGAVPVLIELLSDESEELKDNAAEALINFSEDPTLRERISQVVDTQSFWELQQRFVRFRMSDEHTVRSLRQMSIDQFVAEPELA
ncbi:protein ARABIDILLO 1 [Aristolochia californica]|uniref:protein ARABIDILLO 1 n=1 Tax=Aristolochia californica TaxID=171875 RepID=UPI0035D87A17